MPNPFDFKLPLSAIFVKYSIFLFNLVAFICGLVLLGISVRKWSFLFVMPIYQVSMPSIATPTHWEFSMSILKNNVWVSLLRAWIFGIWALQASNSQSEVGIHFEIGPLWTVSQPFPALLLVADIENFQLVLFPFAFVFF